MISPIVWLLPPMIYRTVNPDAAPEEAYILACKSVLPVGMVGMLVAAMFSATGSMVSSQLNVFAGVLTDEFYHRLFRPNATEKQLVRAGRGFTLLLGAILIGVALAIPYLGGAEKTIVAITSLMVGPLLAPTIWGLFSKRITICAVWATASVSFVLGAICKIGLSSGGWLVNGNTQGLSEWIVNNDKTVDLIIGVMLPVAVLVALQFLNKNTAPGWRKVATMIAERGNSAVIHEVSAGPGLIVSVWLFACAALMFALMPFAETGSRQLAIFGAILLAIALLIVVFIALKYRRKAV